ncbi:hypothetical protein TTHERM_00856710 (macronuclear) [Tetrahymena thermophila SB210]|uniref:Uncharacterized protein n=1 Tax=Tetrahymena thermophila (strain SB210) TaxID=312017 RepID=Q23CI9_TETTS|nr:hypothetical protein TTHERM_00856710 [Tetrahymena thermophila SB210]EAR94291.2 hypothetical protein TTHERM_00856710 [Tetrahymena thermophila SB210]|eukprot:XP_001014536.2 hypothetical protein TTHERM_00856710 [Tetrahymena thermophila SB210]
MKQKLKNAQSGARTHDLWLIRPKLQPTELSELFFQRNKNAQSGARTHDLWLIRPKLQPTELSELYIQLKCKRKNAQSGARTHDLWLIRPKLQPTELSERFVWVQNLIQLILIEKQLFLTQIQQKYQINYLVCFSKLTKKQIKL